MTVEEQILPRVSVPRSLIGDADRFGGACHGDMVTGDLILRGGHAVAMRASDQRPERLVVPALVEPHVHLDKCHSVDRIADVGGDLMAAITAQAKDREFWTRADLHHRAGQGLRELRRAGCDVIRTHIDWHDSEDGGAAPIAWSVLGEITADLPVGLRLERAALTGVDRLADPDWAKACATRMARDDGVLGAFVLGHARQADGLRNAFVEADRLGLKLDFHVDESLDPTLTGVETIADIALETSFQGPILMGHASALSMLLQSDVARVADKLAKANITLCALPSTNLYLQGRDPFQPGGRGLTPINALRRAGVRVVLGTDNVRDAFCPLGRHDPRESLKLAVLAAHLDPPFGEHLPMITTQARVGLGLPPRTVDGAAIGDLILFDAPSVSAWLTDDMPANALTDALTGDRI